ncbi:DUF1049 domain-containing protein [Pontixanthobacter luteolus]|uniref:DUF1049 domain-containing protein n=1 Tax=Pontixanthobacter luteolus TaxID=295089 RepID=UPI00230384BA|nr:DUF1049 domain-containing protein [Pontixanthobacter luteolus]
MQVVRTILWVLLFVGLLAFSFFNWKPVEVTIWENLVLETKVPALVIISFLLGMIPTWLLHRGTKWRMNRRIKTLENAARSAAVSPSSPPATTTTEAASPSGTAAAPVEPAPAFTADSTTKP